MTDPLLASARSPGDPVHRLVGTFRQTVCGGVFATGCIAHGIPLFQSGVMCLGADRLPQVRIKVYSELMDLSARKRTDHSTIFCQHLILTLLVTGEEAS
jgi:hypothetical protein